jgi:hypothetical protein
MLRLAWKSSYGSVNAQRRPIVLSATRFTYRSLADLPGVFWHGLGLRRNWPKIAGAVGVFLAGDVWQRTTYTVSAWNTESDLRRWLASPEHMRLVRQYRSRVQSSAAVLWNSDQLRVHEIFREGMVRLADMDRLAHDCNSPTRRTT